MHAGPDFGRGSEAWLKSWKEAIANRNLTTGAESKEFHECSSVTRLLASELWRSWHDMQPSSPTPGVRFDSVRVDGETLLHAISLVLFQEREPTAHDIDVVRVAVQEMLDAGLVRTEHAGCWTVSFGESYSGQELTEQDEYLKSVREKYALQACLPPPVEVGVPPKLLS